MLKRIQKSVAFRMQMARFGILYGRSNILGNSFKIAGRKFHLSFPKEEKNIHETEIGKILFEDCYGLRRVRRPSTILDIGANIGLFSVAARHYFPDSTIQAYEPNKEVEPFLKENCKKVSVSYFNTAIGIESGMASLRLRENSLHSVLIPEREGNISVSSFRDAVNRIGGKVDLLKLDCEGGEWEILEDIDSWSKVKFVTMEYHLWAKPGSTLSDLTGQLDRLGFICVTVEPSPNGPFGMLSAKRKEGH